VSLTKPRRWIKCGEPRCAWVAPGCGQRSPQSQWLWRKNPANLTEQEAARMAGIQGKSLRTA